MEKQTKILIGIGIAIATILILSPKKASPQVVAEKSEQPIGDGAIKGGGVSILENPVGDSHPPALPVVEATKDCVVTYFSCGSSSTSETIQIPIGDSCEKHQPALPQCAPPSGGGMFMVAPMPLNFVNG